MRKVTARLLLLLIIVIAAYSLEQKLDWYTAMSGADDAAAGKNGGSETLSTLGNAGEQSKFEQLELELADALRARSDRFSVSYTGDKQELSDNMTDVIRAALKHDDYVAYILESYLYTIRTWGNRSTITIDAKYRETKEQTAAVDRKVDQVLAEIIKPQMNDHEKVLAIHDWIVTNVEYDQTLSYYTAYHAVTLGETVCQGYSLLAYKMLQQAGIDVLIAEGTVNTGEHAWNMVQLDGQWYHLDATWDDPVGAADSRIRYTYYLKTDEELRADHHWTRSYPAADKRYADTLRELQQHGDQGEAERFNRLAIRLGLHWLEPEHTIADQKQLSAVIQSAVRSRTNSLQFRYLNSKEFTEALKAAFEGVNVPVGYKASYEPYASDNSLLVHILLSYER